VHLHGVNNPLLEVVTNAKFHHIQEVGFREVADNTGNMSKCVESSLDKARLEFIIGCLGVGISQHFIEIVIVLGVFHGRWDIISLFVLWTLAPKTNMLLEMM